MQIGRSIRKRIVRHPVRASEIAAVIFRCLGRMPTAEEIEIWERKGLPRKGLERRIARLPEALSVARAIGGEGPVGGPALPALLEAMSEEDFVRAIYEHVLGRHPSPAELHAVASQLHSGSLRRDEFMASSLAGRVGEAMAWAADDSRNDATRFGIMGTRRSMTTSDWRARARAAAASADGRPLSRHARFPLRRRTSEVDVSVICSLWRGGDFIERYLDNITSQSIFEDRCELVIVDANSPEGEGEAIGRCAERFGHRVVYHRLPYRAGIYVAWNVGVGLARGRYLTNANLDDLRRVDSLELQASTLDALPHVDVVYQDFLYSADPTADFETVANVDVRSDLPLVTRNGLFVPNPPHNAPMWRSTLHDRIGLFDERFRSAGDYEFWIRAIIAGAAFYKINDPHVVYFNNPDGISTSRQTAGVQEAREILKRHGHALVPEAAAESPDTFRRRLGIDRWPTHPNGVPLSRYEAVQQRMRRLAAAHGSPQTGARA